MYRTSLTRCAGVIVLEAAIIHVKKNHVYSTKATGHAFIEGASLFCTPRIPLWFMHISSQNCSKYVLSPSAMSPYVYKSTIIVIHAFVMYRDSTVAHLLLVL